MRSLRAIYALLIVGTMVWAPSADAGSQTINAIDSGWYDSTGFHDPSNTNYLTGYLSSNNTVYRGFHVWAIPSSMANSNRTITQVTININRGGFAANIPGTEVVVATEVSTAVSTLRAGGTGQTGIFNDLSHEGGTYGAQFVTGSDSTVTFTNNTNLPSHVRLRAGSQLAVGTSLSTINPSGFFYPDQYVFGNSHLNDSPHSMTIFYADADLNVTGGGSFGDILVGSTSASRSITVRNSGESGSTLTGTIGSSGDSNFTPNSGSTPFSLAQNVTSSRSFTFTPTVRGLDSTSVLVSSNDGNTSIALSGRGVAPVEQFTSIAHAGAVRLGTSGSASVVIRNSGDGNASGLGVVSNLRGSMSLASADSEFSGANSAGISLTDGSSQQFSYTYTPTDRISDSQILQFSYLNGSDDGRNLANTQFATISGHGVGPEFAASQAVGSTLDFGDVWRGDLGSLGLTISNLTPDIGYDMSLTGLTLLSATITGPDAGLFSLIGFTPGTVLNPLEMLPFSILFQDTTGIQGTRMATLAIVTDQNAAFGSAGDTFTWNLQATTMTPEPSSLALLGFGALGLIGVRRRKRQVAVE